MTARPHGEADCDLAILGAGPAGAAAAVEAAALGLRTIVLDEAHAAGGQVHAIAPGVTPPARDVDRAGDALRAALAESGAEFRCGRRVWHLERHDGLWRVHALAAPPERGSVDVAESVSARALLIATGAIERHLPFPGWERPGVIGLAAATRLLKAQRVLPGKDVLVAGAGPLLYLVAHAIVEGGGKVVAVVDARSRRDWLASLPAMATRPDLVAKGLGWRRKLLAHRVPVLHSHRLAAVAGDATALRAKVVAIERDGAVFRGTPTIEFGCDAVCVGYGLLPATDATRLAGATHVFDGARGAWRVDVDDDQRTDRALLYVAGDGAGIAGAAAAPWAGRVAACAAARDLGRLDARAFRTRAGAAKRARDRAARFGFAMAKLANVGDGAHAGIAAATLVCQCERVDRAAIDAAVDAGCATLNELRSSTRCGMGPCGGRLCEDAVARLANLRAGLPRAAIGQPTGRPPLRPVDLDALAGEFDYASLPIGTPAPL